MITLTANRKMKGDDSSEETIRQENTIASLPSDGDYRSTTTFTQEEIYPLAFSNIAMSIDRLLRC